MELSKIDERIIAQMRSKRNNKAGSKSVGMTEKQYKKRKEELRNLLQSDHITTKDNYITVLEDTIVESKYDIEAGTGYIKGIFSEEPMSAEEVEEKFKIDKTLWRLSTYWNKQQSNGKFLVSANITRKRNDKTNSLEILSQAIKECNYQYIPFLIKEKPRTQQLCGILSLQDIHVGKASIDGLDTVISDVKKSVIYLAEEACSKGRLDKLVWVIGGDLLNMDTYGGTTTAGTPVENSMDLYKAFKIALDIQIWCINYLKTKCDTLEVVYIPGNHSRSVEANIAYSLSQLIQDKNIIWNIEYAERKVIQYGVNMICLEHGDYSTEKSFFAFATEYPEIWGNTTNRVVYTGHYHKMKTIKYITQDEISGFQLKILPSLSRTDKYHYSNKWTNNARAAIMEVLSFTQGYTAQFNYNA